MDGVHHAWTDTVSVCLGRVPGTHLQAIARWQAAGYARYYGPSGEAVWMDSRDRLSVGECAVCGGVVELARAEVGVASGQIGRIFNHKGTKDTKKTRDCAARSSLCPLCLCDEFEK